MSFPAAAATATEQIFNRPEGGEPNSPAGALSIQIPHRIHPPSTDAGGTEIDLDPGHRSDRLPRL